MSDRRVSDDMIRTVLLLPDESDEAARFRLPRPQRVHEKIVGGSAIRKLIKHPVEERRADLQQALPRSPVRRSVGGSPGVRQRLGAPRKWVVEFRLRASNWPCSQREWIGTFDTEEQAQFAYDAAQHFLGNPTYYFVYPKGFFELCSPSFKDTPRERDFVEFVKEKANQYAMDDGGPADLEVTSLSLSADSELISDAAVEATQLVCNKPSQTTPHESTFDENGANWSDSDGLPPLKGLPLYVCSQNDISEMDRFLIAGFDVELNEMPTPEGASGSIVASLETPFP